MNKKWTPSILFLVLCFIYFGKFIHSIVSLYMLLKNALEQFVFFLCIEIEIGCRYLWKKRNSKTTSVITQLPQLLIWSFLFGKRGALYTNFFVNNFVVDTTNTYIYNIITIVLFLFQIIRPTTFDSHSIQNLFIARS